MYIAYAYCLCVLLMHIAYAYCLCIGTGRDIGRIDATSELAHRNMLTNMLRLLGAVKNAKEERGVRAPPQHGL